MEENLSTIEIIRLIISILTIIISSGIIGYWIGYKQAFKDLNK